MRIFFMCAKFVEKLSEFEEVLLIFNENDKDLLNEKS